MNSTENIYGIILAGGSGTRLWPLSRQTLPKQLIPFFEKETLLKRTAIRLIKSIPPEKIYTVTHQNHLAEVSNQLLQIDPKLVGNILAEPISCNTLPAISWATAVIADKNPEALIGVFPSDHAIADEVAFEAAFQRALRAAKEEECICLFGILPRKASSSYGYIETTPSAANSSEEARSVSAFREKPDRQTAETYLKSGRHFWNGGIFIYRANYFLNLLAKFHPSIRHLVTQLASVSDKTTQKSLYQSFPNLSVDYGLIEKTPQLKVVPVEMGWTDLGGWEAVYEHLPQDQNGNVIRGDVLFQDCENNLLWSDGKPLAVLGVSNLCAVQVRDVTFVCQRNKIDELKSLVSSLQASRPELFASPPSENRPWGQFTVIQESPGFKIKWITVDSGQSLSLQMHHHRSEHWVVVSGTARVELDDQELILEKNKSIYIQQGSMHRLSNPGPKPLAIIEVQVGSYLGEDDIVRFKDRYGRN